MSVQWDEEHAAEAVKPLGDSEVRLLWRIADARGARVPLSELVRDYGLPAGAAAEHDFPGLARYSAGDAESRPSLPVIAGGTGDEAWYWMDPAVGVLFRKALEDKVFPTKAEAKEAA